MTTKEEILAVLKKHLLENVPGLEDSQIDPAKSMLDLGASSLDIVEVVSCTMRELRIKVPRSKLADLKNIGELVALLNESAAAPAP